MPRIKLTELIVKKLPLKESKGQVEFFDIDLPGFAVVCGIGTSTPAAINFCLSLTIYILPTPPFHVFEFGSEPLRYLVSIFDNDGLSCTSYPQTDKHATNSASEKDSSNISPEQSVKPSTGKRDRIQDYDIYYHQTQHDFSKHIHTSRTLKFGTKKCHFPV
jgi:hypothetical protein